MGRLLRPGDVVALRGGLGAGKTVFARGVAWGLGCKKHEVKSPSFVLVNIYHGAVPIYHIDFYRLIDARDLRNLGLEEMLYGKGVSVIEWAQKFPQVLPDDRITVALSFAGQGPLAGEAIARGGERNIEVQGKGARAKGVVEQYAHCPEIRRNIRG